MNSVGESIRVALPSGTRGGNTWDAYPEWPPDLFGVTAYLLDQSGAYAWLRPKAAGNAFAPKGNDPRLRLREIGQAWSRGDWLAGGAAKRKRSRPAELRLKRLWGLLWSHKDEPLAAVVGPRQVPEWAVTALYLLIIADEASAGIGFFPDVASDDGAAAPLIPVMALNNFFFPTGRRKARRAKPRRPFTLGWFLDAQILCVLPKTRTPGVGCTIRSLSHHLALLGGVGEVRARWHVNPVIGTGPDLFNLLVIPFPYRIRGRSFSRTQRFSKWGMFELEQTWLPRVRGAVDARAVTKFVLSLVKTAANEVGNVQGILLPELALDSKCYASLRRAVERTLPNLRFLISGVRGERRYANRNLVKVTAFYPGRLRGIRGGRSMEAAQSKHHRWKLDRAQISRYSLGDALDPNCDWWENVDVHGRELNFFVFGSASCFTTLICEDLARVDPGQQVLRAVGPNIVFALLMDGPQLVSRWPGRSCAVLAEDPGSSVLTVTSMGLVERSAISTKSTSRCIALWKDPSGSTLELELPSGSHALCLTLTGRCETERTLDGRDDGGKALYWNLSGATPLQLPKPPAWL